MTPLAGRARRIYRVLAGAYPDARVPLDYGSPFELLVGTILAAQCTDKKVNEVTPRLFAEYPSAEALTNAPVRGLEREIRATGFFRMKAKALRESAQDLVGKHAGAVPDTMEALTALRGVGRKTASVVLGYAFGKPAIIVDTHFIRLSRRMALTAEFDPGKIEADVAALLPRGAWTAFSLLMTWHGRATCIARKPACGRCVVAGLCPASGSDGAITWKVKVPKAAAVRREKEKGPRPKRPGPRKA
jgi:endonuclease-3